MTEFTDYLQEVFRHFGPVQSKKMFGGYGVYHDGIMFGLVADECLYLKADPSNLAYFEAKGLGPFEYERQGKTVQLSYYQAPDEVYDDADEARTWARRSFEIALRTKRGSKSKAR